MVLPVVVNALATSKSGLLGGISIVVSSCGDGFGGEYICRRGGGSVCVEMIWTVGLTRF